MAPYMTPWSVMASAGISSLAAASTSGWMRLAPSSSEYSVWLWRWTKVLGACGIVWLWVWRTPAERLSGPIALTTAQNAGNEDLGRAPAEPGGPPDPDRRRDRHPNRSGHRPTRPPL